MVVVRETEPVVEHEHIVSDGNNGTGIILGIAFFVVVIFLFFYYLLPAVRNNYGSPSVNVPGKMDVNVHQTK
jgi:hypothetical protein